MRPTRARMLLITAGICFFGLSAFAMTAGFGPKSFGCGVPAEKFIAEAKPIDRGPMHLESVHCLTLPSSSYPVSPPSPSPDGKHYFAYDSIEGLWIGKFGSEHKPLHVKGRLTLQGLGFAETLPFSWLADSSGILGARQETANPSGFALEPVIPISISLGGALQPLPTLDPTLGRLDGILWVGDRGLAVAESGTKGGFYKPERVDTDPAIALVDGNRGKILQTIQLSELQGRISETRILDIDARLDKSSKIHTVFALSPSKWFEWKQGFRPKEIPANFKNGRYPFKLAADGKNMIVMHNLSANGIICEFYSRNDCPPPTPTKGRIAELRDIATGKVHWSISGTASNFSRSLKPAVSSDGRFALINIPSDGSHREHIALISMRNGKILQRVPNALQLDAFGFSNDGKSVWVSGRRFFIAYGLMS